MLSQKNILLICFSLLAIFVMPIGFIFARNAQLSLEIFPLPICSDGIDNDGDGFTDYPDDADCETYNDMSESTSTSTQETSSSGSKRNGVGCDNMPQTLRLNGYNNGYNRIVVLLDDIVYDSFEVSPTFPDFSLVISNQTVGPYLVTLYGITPENIYGEKHSFYATIFPQTETTIKDITLPPPPTQNICVQKGDLNNDCLVNLIDFSIAIYWYGKKSDPQMQLLEKTRLNGDGKITLLDFSIMMYHWTPYYE